MRLLNLCHDHPEFTPAGTEIFAWELTRHIDQVPGETADFLAVSTSLTRPGTPSGGLERFGPDYLLRTGPYDRFTMERMDGSTWAENLGALIRENDYDVVHFQGLDRIGASTVTFLRQRFPHLRLVLTLHDYQLICPNDGLLLRVPDNALCRSPDADACRRCFPDISVTRHALRKAHLQTVLTQIDAFVAPSHFIRDQFVAWGSPADKIHIIPNAAALATDCPSAPQDFQPRTRFAFFGNLAQHKGIDILLRAAERLAAQGSDIAVNIYGDMPFAEEARRAAFATACAAAAPVAQYLGPYTPADLPGLIAATDWIVLPSLWFENAPLTVLEARKAGKPVICTALGGLPELVEDGVSGLFVPRGDARALADTIARAAADTALWHRLAANVTRGPDFAETAEAYRTLYRALLREVPA